MWDEILAIILPPAIYLSFAINILDGSRWSYFGLSTPFNEMAPLCNGFLSQKTQKTDFLGHLLLPVAT